jgi:hypothetical protein
VIYAERFFAIVRTERLLLAYGPVPNMSSFLKTGQMIAMKPAGGTHTSKQTLHYLMMVKEELGEEWLSNHWFRFGASSLANDILIVAERGERALPEYGSLLCGSGPERAGPAPIAGERTRIRGRSFCSDTSYNPINSLCSFRRACPTRRSVR